MRELYGPPPVVALPNHCHLVPFDDFANDKRLVAGFDGGFLDELGFVGGDDEAHADAHVEDFVEFVEFHAAFANEVIKNRECWPGAVVDFCAATVWEDAWEISGEAAAGDVTQAVDGVVFPLFARAVVEFLGERERGRAVVDVRLEQSFGKCHFAAGKLIGDLVLQLFKDDFAGQGISIGVQAVGGKADDQITGFDGGSAEDAFLFHDADDAAYEIVFTGLIKARHLRRFSADQGAIGGFAGGFHAGNELVEDFGVELPKADVIKEEQGLRAHDGDVIDAMVHDVLADAFVIACFKSELQFRANAIDGGNEHWLLDLHFRQIEQSAETTDSGENFRTAGRFESLFESVFHGIALGDIDSGFSVGRWFFGGGHEKKRGKREKGELGRR